MAGAEDDGDTPGGNDSGVLNHQDHAFLRRPCPVDYALGHHESLAWSESHGAILQIHQKLAIEAEEEFVVVFVFVPARR